MSARILALMLPESRTTPTYNTSDPTIVQINCRGFIVLSLVPVLQVLVFIACMLVVGFVLLLPLPNMRGPLALPSIALSWFITLGLTMLLQVGVTSLGVVLKALTPWDVQEMAIRA